MAVFWREGVGDRKLHLPDLLRFGPSILKVCEVGERYGGSKKRGWIGGRVWEEKRELAWVFIQSHGRHCVGGRAGRGMEAWRGVFSPGAARREGKIIGECSRGNESSIFMLAGEGGG